MGIATTEDGNIVLATELDTLRIRLSEVKAAIHARVTGSEGVGGAVTEFRKGDRVTRWAQMSYRDLVAYRDELEREIEKAEAKESGLPTRRAAWMY
jgi:gpW